MVIILNPKKEIAMSQQHGEEIYCLSYFYAKPPHRGELIATLLKLVEPTRAEAGCLQYDLLLDNENPNFLILVEKFIDRKALADHQELPHIKHFIDKQMDQFCEKVIWNVAREIKKRTHQ